MPSPALLTLAGVVRHYGWGSTTAIAELLGVRPDGRPAAELWFGAHPEAPSSAGEPAAPLDTLIAAQPLALLGADLFDAFGPRLPFLLKVLAADRALSIQVHPTVAQARAGFAAEDARGVPLDSPERNYRDANHKPELICALSAFEALCGFRPVAATLRLFAALAVPELVPYQQLLAGPDGLRDGFSAILSAADPAALVAAVAGGVATLPPDSEWAGPARAFRLAAQDAPGDVGAVLTLLLNYVRLEPGQAIYLDAGNVHAYLRGVGVEIMANSDNVLRCGLTPKHVDVAEVLRIADFVPLVDPLCVPHRPSPGVVAYPVPVPDFALSRIEVGDSPVHLPAGGPQILLCTEGAVTVRDAGADASVAGGSPLPKGQAVFVPAGMRLSVEGIGVLFQASSG
ncbi:MAG TPA: mannose-6-phosphate isomerase, class I [Jatrophihabitantaceae bacterium]|nr:mannose-6-phosphate isomerase, class I [Jatrophihabitantaceae bacterium]